MPEEYVSGRDIFTLVLAIDTKVTTLVSQAEVLAERAREDRAAVERTTSELSAELDALKTRVYMMLGGVFLVSAVLSGWDAITALLGK